MTETFKGRALATVVIQRLIDEAEKASEALIRHEQYAEAATKIAFTNGLQLALIIIQNAVTDEGADDSEMPLKSSPIDEVGDIDWESAYRTSRAVRPDEIPF